MPTRALSSDSLMLIQRCLEAQKGQLERLHWQICPFLPPALGKKGENATETLRNIAKFESDIDKANTELARAFDKQFSQKDHARAAGLTLYAWRKREKKFHENQKLVGNPRALPKGR